VPSPRIPLEARNLLASLKFCPKGGVDNVHTFGFGLGCTSPGLARIAYVFWTSECFPGLESGFESHLGHTIFPGQWNFLL
jgi:hypothetical protein